MEKDAKKTKYQVDTISYFEDLIVSSRKLRFVCFVLTFILLMQSFVIFYVFFLKKERVVILDSAGKPYITNTIEDRVFKTEAQLFVEVVLSILFERTYVDFEDKEKLKKIVIDLSNYFSNENDLQNFWNFYKNSVFVKSITTNKLITKINVHAFDFRQTKEGNIEAVGNVNITSYSVKSAEGSLDISGQSSESQKQIVLRMQRGIRSIRNPFGLYVISVYERGDIKQ